MHRISSILLGSLGCLLALVVPVTAWADDGAASPSAGPSVSPSAGPSASPSVAATNSPTATPSNSPAATPSGPSSGDSAVPSAGPASPPSPSAGRTGARLAQAELVASIEPDAVGFGDRAFIVGRATEPGTGRPIVGGVISFLDQIDGGPQDEAAITDDDGRFRISWTPPGFDSVPTEDGLAYVEVAVRSETFVGGTRATYIHLDAPREARLTAEASPDPVRDRITITGRVVDPVTGDGVPDVVLSAVVQVDGGPLDPADTTGSDGRFSFTLSVPSRDSLRWIDQDRGLAAIRVFIVDPVFSGVLDVPFSVVTAPSASPSPTPSTVPSESSSAVPVGDGDAASGSGESAGVLAQTGGSPLGVVVGGLVLTLAGLGLLIRRTAG